MTEAKVCASIRKAIKKAIGGVGTLKTKPQMFRDFRVIYSVLKLQESLYK